MASEFDILAAFELHDVKKIRALLDAGLDVRAPIKGKPLVHHLTEMYMRSEKFADCLRLLLDRGAVLDDPALAPVLLDDGGTLEEALRAHPSLIGHRTCMVSAYTSLLGVSLLHVAAEFGCMNAARVLIEHGAEVDACAAIDERGLNGHTPFFHTVNSNHNWCEPVMRLLLDAGATTDIRLHGITWGKGFEWQTICFDVTPISYAQMGLLPQVHRRDRDIYANIARLLERAGRSMPPFENVPNRHLK